MQLPQSVIYVSPGGSDQNEGTQGSPLRSFQAAADKAALENIDTVFFLPGHYIFTQTAVLDTSHNGIAFIGQEGVVFSSLVPVTEWTPCNECSQSQVWKAPLPAGLEQVRFVRSDHQTWMPRAASPPFSTIEIAGGDDNGCIECNAYTPETQGDMSNIQYPLSFSVPSETPAHWLDLRANTLPWHLDLIPVDFVSQSDRRIFTQIPALYDLRRDANEAPPTAWLVNSLDHLDDAFEWVSFDGTLYVSSNVSPDTVYIPMLTELIRIDNGQSMPYGLVDNPVKDLLFDNITFSGADYRMLQSDDVTSQHDWAVIDQPDALVRIRNAASCTIRNCTFSQSGGTGLRFDRSNTDHTITENVFSHLGRNGLVIAGRGAGFGNVCMGHQVSLNQFSFIGLEDWDSPAILLDHCQSSSITQNYLHDLYFTGVVLTATRQLVFAGISEDARDFYVGREFRFWDIAEEVIEFVFDEPDLFVASREAMQFTYNAFNTVSGNLFVNVSTGQGMFQNGKIYVTGFPWSTNPDSLTSNTVEYNYFYDTFSPPHADYVIYADSDMDSCLIKGNMINGVENGELPLLILDNQWAEDEYPGRGKIASVGNLITQSTYCGLGDEDPCHTIGKGFTEEGIVVDGIGADSALVQIYQKMYMMLCPEEFPFLDSIPGAETVRSELSEIITGFGASVPSCAGSSLADCSMPTVSLSGTDWTGGNVWARDTVRISGQIVTPDSVIIQAGEHITLQPGAIIQGGMVSIRINPCEAPSIVPQETPQSFQNLTGRPDFNKTGIPAAPECTLFPNPANGQSISLYLLIPDYSGPVQATILTPTGTLIEQMNWYMPFSTLNAFFSIGGLPNGLYAIVITAGHEKIVRKFVIQRI